MSLVDDKIRPRGYHVVNHLPAGVRARLVAASLVEWPQVALGESHARRVAVDEAVTWARKVAPAYFKPL